jgi:hypothetical protein
MSLGRQLIELDLLGLRDKDQLGCARPCQCSHSTGKLGNLCCP